MSSVKMSQPQPQPHSGRARSSRRTLQSHGPSVILGGGVGVLGHNQQPLQQQAAGTSTSRQKEALSPTFVAPTTAPSATSRSPFPVQPKSATSPSVASSGGSRSPATSYFPAQTRPTKSPLLPPSGGSQSPATTHFPVQSKPITSPKVASPGGSRSPAATHFPVQSRPTNSPSFPPSGGSRSPATAHFPVQSKPTNSPSFPPSGGSRSPATAHFPVQVRPTSTPSGVSSGGSRSPATAHFPVQFHSPTSPSFDTPPPTKLPSAFSVAEPIPPTSMPSPASVTKPKPPPSMPSSSSVSGSKPPQSGESNRSLSTTASTSSRTLKTPASKLETQHVTIVDGGDSLDGHAPYQYGDQTSPTPSRAMDLPRKSGERLRLPFIPPPLAQGPLPQAPVPTNDRKASGPTNRPRARPAPPTLQTKMENRLSQDWVDLSLPTRPSPPRESIREQSISPSPKPTASSLRLPPVSMIPMKGDSLSPSRPLFERTVSAPPLSPTGGDKSRSQRPARSSLDQLRNASPSPDPFRNRQNSMSMPPQAILDTGASSSSGGRLNIWRTAPAKPAAPELRTRRSEDLLRPGRPSLDALSKKELKAAQKEAQRNLGVASTAFMYTPPAQSEERKPSGLSLKKSSGALKALFKTKGKDKDRFQTPPVPTRPARPSTAPSYEAPRPSFTLNRSLTPGSPASNRTLPLDMGRASASADRSMSSGGRSSMSAEHSMEGGRSSLSVERTFVREPSPTPAPTTRSASQGSHPVMLLPAPASRVRIPARELPPLPPPSPVPPREMTPTPTPPPAQTQTAPPSTPPKHSLLEDAFPASSSLPYLGPRASLVMDSMAGIHGSAVGTPTTAASSSTSNSTARPESESEDTSPYLKTSRSLHLLQLPELDLDFGVTFDSLGLGLSPSTPRKSPKSPARSNTTLRPRTSPSPKSISRAATITDRRRSRSFDGLDDFWRGERIFGQPSSSSAPMLSEPILPQSVPMEPVSMQAGGSTHSHTQSVSSTSAPSSSDHARTPSNASSTNDTPSPSPPRTPPGAEHRSMRAFGFDFDSPSPLPTPTPAHAVPAVEDEIDSLTIGKTFVLNEPPTIPLPALPSESAAITLPDLPPAPVLEPAAVIEASVPILKPVQPEAKRPQASLQRLMTRSRLVLPDLSFSNKSLGREIERLLYTYPHCATSADRADVIRNDLLPLLADVERRPFVATDEGNASLREACFRWAELMLVELRVEQAATERGSCLEALACAMESPCLSEEALQGDKRHHDKFDSLMIECMSFVMGKLGAKGVFHNMLLFSGRFLAFAFFRVPHVGEQLVTVLQPPRGALMRFTRSALIDESVPLEARPTFPSHLAGLCFDDSRTYTARLASLTAEFATDEQRDAFLFQPGNWLRRWQSDDSELFPAFYRAYHRQLAIYLTAAIKHYEGLEQPLPASLLLRAPGYAHLATIFAKKCHSYILGSVNAVTTSSNAQNFEATETAGFRGSQKPAVLETANRRLVETLSTFANIRVNIPDGGSILEVEGQQLYSSMLDLWTKSIIAKTSLYAPKGVFCLFDLLDGIVDPPVDFISGERDLKAPSLIDVPHLIHVLRLILTQGEHALTLVKVIAFVFTHWEVLTTRAEDRRQLCQELFLSKEVFERLLLFWSQSVRSYVLRLVVFRLGHLHTTKNDGEAHEVEIESVRLLQTRLDRIKRRHDELEPVSLGEGVEAVVPLTPIEGSGGMTRSRSTITMVADSPRRGSSNKAERLLGLGFGQQESKGEIEVDGAAGSKVGKATNWLKKSFGGATKKRRKDGSTSESPSPNLDSSPLLGTSPNIPRASPSVRQSPLVPSAPSMPSPVSPHSDDTTGSASPTGETSSRRPRPPKITTTSPSAASTSSSSPTAFAFEFELPTMSPRSDHFDPSPSPLANASPRAKRTSQPPSPHMSRSFSKRASLLPPSTANALAQELAVAAGDNLKREAEEQREKEEKAAQDKGYDKKLHAYAIRMLAELEDAQKEYDEWWSDGGVGRVGGCPPRLTVAWPFHEGEE